MSFPRSLLAGIILGLVLGYAARCGEAHRRALVHGPEPMTTSERATWRGIVSKMGLGPDARPPLIGAVVPFVCPEGDACCVREIDGWAYRCWYETIDIGEGEMQVVGLITLPADAVGGCPIAVCLRHESVHDGRWQLGDPNYGDHRSPWFCELSGTCCRKGECA